VVDLRVVGSGVDSLYCSIKGELYDGILVFFKDFRALSPPGEDAPLQLHDDEGAFLFKPHGWRGYPVWLSSPNYDVFLGASAPFPPGYVQLRSPFIHSVGIETAVAETHRVLVKSFFPGGCQLTPSRIDLYVDQQGWQPSPDDFRRFACRGVRRTQYEEFNVHQQGTRLSGFTFGKGDIVARVYDKTLQMARSGQSWQELVWHGHDPNLPVWRIEVQLRREALVTFGLRNIDHAIEHRQGLWEYGMRWLSLRVPTKAEKRWRWPEDPTWVALRGVPIGAPSSLLIRERIREADERRLVSGFIGYASSIAALGNETDTSSLVRRALPLAHDYLRERGTSVPEIVRRKREKRLAVGKEWGNGPAA